MPRKELMSYEGAPYFRWVKMHRGTRYRVACKDLPGVRLHSREATAAAANEWWTRKVAELEGVGPRQRILDEHEAEDFRKARTPEFHQQMEFRRAWHEVERKIEAGVPVEEITEIDVLVPPARTRPDRSVGAVADAFLTRVRQGKKGRPIAPRSFADVQDFVQALVSHIGGREDVGVLDASRVEAVYAWVAGRWTAGTAKKKRWAFFTRFVRYCYEREYLSALPRNLDSFGFIADPTTPGEWDTGEVRRVLAGLDDRRRLYALLGLNCGMTNVDIGSLTKDMVDWDKRALTRKRVKTKAVKNVPTVTYPLWPETYALLVKCRADHPTLVLTSMDNTPLYVARMEGGEVRFTDLVKLQWQRGKVDGGPIPLPLKAFRSITATLIKRRAVYRPFVPLFLGHAPASIADRHYAAEDDEAFAEVMTWVRSELFRDAV